MDNTINLTEEQKQELTNYLAEAFRTVSEEVEKVYNVIRKVSVVIWDNLKYTIKYTIEKSKKVKKYISIYNRTHNQRIKKKQLKLIEKVLLE